MSIDALPTILEECPGVTVSRRSPFSVLPALVRDPLQALPPEIYHEPVVYSQVAGRRRILLADPALIHEALVRNADALNKGEDVRRALGPALGQGLLTADGAHWRWQRQSVAPAFRHEKLMGLLPAMIAAAEKTRDRWLASGSAIGIGHEMMRTTFDIIVETMMSGPAGNRRGEGRERHHGLSQADRLGLRAQHPGCSRVAAVSRPRPGAGRGYLSPFRHHPHDRGAPSEAGRA